MDLRRAVEVTLLLEHGLDFSSDRGILCLPLSQRRLLPALPGLVAAAGHAQLLAQPGYRVATCELIDQAKLPSGSFSLAKCTAASLKKSFPS
jgi:hypothetical protein